MDAVIEFFVEMWSSLTLGMGAFFDRGAGDIARDCLDIGLVAALIYAGLVVLKGTRAMQMAVGLGLGVVGYLFARQLGLISVLRIYDSLLTNFVLVVVVIFQADIRRALMRMGRGSLFQRSRTARETAVLEEVIRAAGELAQKRIGAMVVFERDAVLEEFIEPGTGLDAEVTRELLYSIFIPSFENPMHDGAVIVRDGRVWQAGAVLPLSSGSHDRSLGTRHRAAIGITEETDAVAVVVSEERGSVSLCFNGNIVRNLDGDSLREALFGLFYKPKEPATSSRTTSPGSASAAVAKPKPKPKPKERVTLPGDDPELAAEPTSELDSIEEPMV